MKYNYTNWYTKHSKQEPIREYSGIARQFVPDYPPENKPKFIPDKLLNSKQLTQR